VYSSPVTFDTEDARSCNFKEINTDMHLRLTTYFSYLLSIDENTRQQLGDWGDLSITHSKFHEQFYPEPTKKPKVEADSPKPDSKSKVDTAWLLCRRARSSTRSSPI
jgi:hypothetical protein